MGPLFGNGPSELPARGQQSRECVCSKDGKMKTQYNTLLAPLGRTHTRQFGVLQAITDAPLFNTT